MSGRRLTKPRAGTYSLLGRSDLLHDSAVVQRTLRLAAAVQKLGGLNKLDGQGERASTTKGFPTLADLDRIVK